MNPTAKALWFVEAHLASELSLDEIAKVAGVSRYHMSRAFGAAAGRSLQRYIRGRRMTHAARTLASGANDILTVALDVGYGSHEAFTRAFREEFGVTPEAVRAQAHVDNLKLVEALRMDETLLTHLEPPRFENGKRLLIAGLSERYDESTTANIPAQWQRFGPYLGHVPGQIANIAYGVVWNSDDEGNVDYVTGVEVKDFTSLPPELAHVRVAEHRYAVFSHREHISMIRRTWYTILNKWLPESGHRLADAPEFERYDEKFDARTGNGGLEIWVPVEG
jgi:AraC family transcriptional regulator